MDKALPQAWEDLIARPDDQLCIVDNKKMVKISFGVEATPERIKGFLEGLEESRTGGKTSNSKKETTNTRGTGNISSHPTDSDLSTLDNVADEDLLHAMLSDIVGNYTNAKSINERSIRATVKEYMTSRGFIEFYMLAEWGGYVKFRPLRDICKIDICNALTDATTGANNLLVSTTELVKGNLVLVKITFKGAGHAPRYDSRRDGCPGRPAGIGSLPRRIHPPPKAD